MRNPLYLVYLLIAWMVVSRAAKAWRLARAADAQSASSPQPGGLAMSHLALLAGALLSAAGWWLGAPLFLRAITLEAVQTLVIATAAVAVLDTFLAAKSPRPAAKSPLHAAFAASTPAATLLVGLAILAFALYLRSTPGGSAAALRADFPLRGAWTVSAGGRTALTNPHHDHPLAQSYALDLERSGGQTLGQTVYAPVAGEVVRAVDDPRSDAPEGNVIVIRADSGEDVWLAHLQDDSIQVHPGDRVAAGQPLARCGVSGNAARPHLHIHAERAGLPVPLLFGPAQRFLVRNDPFAN